MKPRLTVALLLLLGSGCGRDLPAGGHGPVRATGGPRPSSAAHTMRWFALDSRPHRALDALLQAPLSPEPLGPAVERLLKLASSMMPDNVFCRVRLAFLKLGDRSRPEALPEALRIADRLEASAPDDPDRLFLDGYLRWLVVSSSAGASVAGAGQPALDGMKASWGELLRRHPSYEGPGGVGAKWLREQLQIARQ